jgi:hypothetical protein
MDGFPIRGHVIQGWEFGNIIPSKEHLRVHLIIVIICLSLQFPDTIMYLLHFTGFRQL